MSMRGGIISGLFFLFERGKGFAPSNHRKTDHLQKTEGQFLGILSFEM
jgi:hypothetical protein